jgi:hypothetical protein
MPRTFGDKLLLTLQNGDPSLLGIRLGRLCVEANLPIAYVATALEVSRNTVHLWFRGRMIQEHRFKVVSAFMYLVEEDMKNGTLPATTLKQAKNYIEGMIGKQV